MRRLHALTLLALALLITLLKTLFPRRRGMTAFTANYAADGLPRVTADERQRLAHFGGCIACGMCDRGEHSSIAASHGAYSGVMSVVLAASRSMPDYAAALRNVAHLDEARLADKERICPTNVPIRDIVEFVKAKASAARVSLAVVR